MYNGGTDVGKQHRHYVLFQKGGNGRHTGVIAALKSSQANVGSSVGLSAILIQELFSMAFVYTSRAILSFS